MVKKIAILSGKGGVGKTTISSLLSIYLSKSKKVLLLDFDLTGPSISSVFKFNQNQNNQNSKNSNNTKNNNNQKYDKKYEEKVKTDANNILTPLTVTPNLHVLSIGYMIKEDDVVIWRFAKRYAFLKKFMETVEKYSDFYDYVVIDTPPGIAEELSLLSKSSKNLELELQSDNNNNNNNTNEVKSIIVTSSQNIALTDSSLSIEYCKKYGIGILGVVENFLGHFYSCEECGKDTFVLSRGGGRKLAEYYGLEYLGSLPVDFKSMLKFDDSTNISNTNLNDSNKNINLSINNLPEPDELENFEIFKEILKKL